MIVIVTLLGICALAIDLGVVYMTSAQLQTVADAAALAGAGAWREGRDEEAACEEAIRTAAANTVLQQEEIIDPNTDIRYGSWDATSHTLVPWNESIGAFAIQVIARRTTGSPNGPVPTFFARIWGKTSVNVSRSAVAGLDVGQQPRAPVQVMIIQDGSSSFQYAWARAVAADMAMVKLINGVAVEHDATGLVTFNAQLPDSWLKGNRPTAGSPTYYDLYRQVPGMNEGLKYTTDAVGSPVKTNGQGEYAVNGQVRPMSCAMISLNPDIHDVLPKKLNDMAKLVENGKAWGDTDTAVGLNYATDQLLTLPSHGADQVIVLVSDGKPHDVRGTYYTQLRDRAAIAAADRAGEAGIIIHTVTLEGTKGVNYEFNEGLARNGGISLRATDADHLTDLLIGIGKIVVGHLRLYK